MHARTATRPTAPVMDPSAHLGHLKSYRGRALLVGGAALILALEQAVGALLHDRAGRAEAAWNAVVQALIKVWILLRPVWLVLARLADGIAAPTDPSALVGGARGQRKAGRGREQQKPRRCPPPDHAGRRRRFSHAACRRCGVQQRRRARQQAERRCKDHQRHVVRCDGSRGGRGGWSSKATSLFPSQGEDQRTVSWPAGYQILRTCYDKLLVLLWRE